MNPCIKTGATVISANQWWHGDLFNFGDYCILNCNSGPNYDRVNFAHAEFATWYCTFQEEKVVVFKNTDKIWFIYEGREL